MIHSWVKYRPLLLHAFSENHFQVQPQPNTAWEALLTAEYVSTQGQNSVAKRLKLRKDILSFIGHTDLVSIDALDLSTQNARWEGKLVSELGKPEYERILWELCELNFRFEFQALDRRLTTQMSPLTLRGRQTRIRNSFPGGCLLVANPKLANHGIASEELRELSHYLFMFADLMKDWPDVLATGYIKQIRTKLKWSPEEIASLENEIARHYTQSFFNSFRRAPVVPVRLSPESIVPSSSEPVRAATMTNQSHIIINTFATEDLDPGPLTSLNLQFLRELTV